MLSYRLTTIAHASMSHLQDIGNQSATHAGNVQQKTAAVIDLTDDSPSRPHAAASAGTLPAASLASRQAGLHGQHPAGHEVHQADEHDQEAADDDEYEEEYEEDEDEDGASEGADEEDDPSGSQLPQGGWKQRLWECVQNGAPPSSFACTHTLLNMPFGCPEVTVEGVGQLALPLCPEQAATLRAAAEQAPYGKGMDTVVDTGVRNALQVSSSYEAAG